MKKIFMWIMIIFMVSTLVFTGCASDEPDVVDEEPDENAEEPAGYEDGIYFAQENEFAPGSGYKDFVILTVDGGVITDAYWGGTHIQPLGNKRTASKEGMYPMVEVGGAAAEWYVQAEAVEKWLIEKQDPMTINYSDEEGHTNAIETDDGTQVSINVMGFFTLAQDALTSDPVTKGSFKTPTDFVANTELQKDDKGWVAKGEFIVVNGTIVDVFYNSIFAGDFNDDTAKYFKTDKEGNPDPEEPSSKLELGEAYGMNWDVQATSVADYVVDTQGLEVEYIDEEGHTDAISGVSIDVSIFEELFKKAFE